MPRKRYRAEEIIHKLREAAVAFARGWSSAEVQNRADTAGEAPREQGQLYPNADHSTFATIDRFSAHR